MNAELVLDAKAEVGEGPSWNSKEEVLYWVDIPRGLFHIYTPKESKDASMYVGDNMSTAVPSKSGAVVLTMKHGFYTLDIKNRRILPVIEVENEPPGNRFNDGKCDPLGRFWAGTMDTKETNATGALYCLTTGERVRKILSDVTISNGLGWSPDNRTMYYIDTPTRKVSAFDYDIQTGDVENRRTVVDFAKQNQPGNPDGMTVDSEGMIWVAHWGGHRVTRWNPATGRLLDQVTLPAAHVSSCCFGGTALNELYITTARSELDEETLQREPLSGGLFRVQTETRGLQTNVFNG